MDRCDVVVVGGPARQGKAAMRQGNGVAEQGGSGTCFRPGPMQEWE
jgi:hypothetical protein